MPGGGLGEGEREVALDGLEARELAGDGGAQRQGAERGEVDLGEPYGLAELAELAQCDGEFAEAGDGLAGEKSGGGAAGLEPCGGFGGKGDGCAAEVEEAEERFHCPFEREEWRSCEGVGRCAGDVAGDAEGEAGGFVHLLGGAGKDIFRFEDGLMLKIKGQWYCQIHGTKELLSREKDVVALIAWDRLDDAKAFMDDGDRARVELFHKDYESGVLAYADYLKREVDNIVLHVGDNRKAFADEVKARSKGGAYREYDSGMIFAIRGGQDAATVVRQRIAKYAHPTAGTATRIDYIRPMIGGIFWNEYRDPNAVSGED